ncbi:hypothetical protein LR090_00565 [Candidatus Bipolaricaulota bacterium]|nr:hypothetical protein [Candidatus Bipolaricaulota bacterium]
MNLDPYIDRYLEELRQKGAISSRAVEEAFRRVKRHRFLNGWYRLLPSKGDIRIWEWVEYDPEAPTSESLVAIYSDQPLVVQVEGVAPTSSTSQPSLVARMLELLELRPGMRVLEIGTGTGYNTALLCELVGDSNLVWTIEVQPHVAEDAQAALAREGYRRVHVVVGDGFYGVHEGVPFDRIEATVGCSDISSHWLNQLAPGGSMLIPLQHGHWHPLVLVTHHPEDPRQAKGRVVDWSGFMPIQGVLAWANPWQALLSGGPGKLFWRRPLPEGLPPMEERDHPLGNRAHLAFQFFLALVARELWVDSCGYGLVEPGAKAVVEITPHGIEGRCPPGGSRACERLYERLLEALERWERLGRPAPEDYELHFAPKSRLPEPPENPERTWLIERIQYWEVVRLP